MPLIGSTIAKIFGLPILGIKTASREGYNKDLGKYFLGAKVDHYVRGSSYVISKVVTSEAQKKLKALSEICTF